MKLTLLWLMVDGYAKSTIRRPASSESTADANRGVPPPCTSAERELREVRDSLPAESVQRFIPYGLARAAIVGGVSLLPRSSVSNRWCTRAVRLHQHDRTYTQGDDTLMPGTESTP